MNSDKDPGRGPYEHALSEVVRKLRNEPFLFVIAIVVLLIGLVVLATALGSSDLQFIVLVIALLTLTVIIGYYMVEVSEVRAKVRAQGERLDEQQEIIKQLVKYSMSRSIFDHLCGIALLKYYGYTDNDHSRREMYFLRDHGFIRPKPPLDFLVFEQLPGPDPKKNLVEFAEPTEIGWFYVTLRKDDIPEPMRADEKNKNIHAWARVMKNRV